jgi:hypothetical protein
MGDTMRDAIDIREKLNGASISDAIAYLTELAKDYPEGDIEITTDMEYGESYAAARLNFTRPKTAVEVELAEWEGKARALDTLNREADAFAKNGIEHPKAAEIEALRRELGFFAMAPMSGMLIIFDGEILVHDMMRGARRRDGTFVITTLTTGSSHELEKMYEQVDAHYRFPTP